MYIVIYSLWLYIAIYIYILSEYIYIDYPNIYIYTYIRTAYKVPNVQRYNIITTGK